MTPSSPTRARRVADRDLRSAQEPGGRRPTSRTCNCARSSGTPNRSAICLNPISPNIARRRRATPSNPRRPTPASISRATVSNVPAYPKKLPTVLIATLATLVLASGLVLTRELLAAPGRAAGPIAPAACGAPAPSGRGWRSRESDSRPKGSSDVAARIGGRRASSHGARRTRASRRRSPGRRDAEGMAMRGVAEAPSAVEDRRCFIASRRRANGILPPAGLDVKLARALRWRQDTRVVAGRRLAPATPRSGNFLRSVGAPGSPNSPPAAPRSATSSPRISSRRCI